ncbi:hypothetical protein Tco_1080285 [Tanacetum coccineum]|uniref:Uncharacterized protein n=1 Tax=Tanacetum coccineum TaxID=301880 RepID=A0ABQ5HVU3_9ASTR
MRHFKILSLDELRSPDFNLLSDQEYSKEEEAEAMAETMEQYMSKTITDYGSGVARPKIELDVPTRRILDSRGVVPTKTIADAKKAIQEMAEYSQKWHNGTSRGRSTETSDGLAVIQAQLNNLGREIKKNSTLLYKTRQTTIPFPIHLDYHYREEKEGNYGPKFAEAYKASHINDIIPRKEKDPGSFTLPCYINNVCFDNALVDLGASISVMPLLTYLNLRLGELAHTRRNQKDDLMPTIEEGEVIKEFRTRDEDLHTGIDNYPSYCDNDKKIHIDYKMMYKGNNVVGAVMNVPIFVGTFSVMTDFVVLEHMEAYRDERMGDVIFGKPFLREVGIKVKRFEGIITLYNGDDEVTYQMVRSHPRFKNYTNEQCNKIPPLLKVSEKDKKNGILHAYQKLKGFYKGVLNLRPDYIRDAKMKEWLTRGHISVHEME